MKSKKTPYVGHLKGGFSVLGEYPGKVYLELAKDGKLEHHPLPLHGAILLAHLLLRAMPKGVEFDPINSVFFVASESTPKTRRMARLINNRLRPLTIVKQPVRNKVVGPFCSVIVKR